MHIKLVYYIVHTYIMYVCTLIWRHRLKIPPPESQVSTTLVRARTHYARMPYYYSSTLRARSMHTTS